MLFKGHFRGINKCYTHQKDLLTPMQVRFTLYFCFLVNEGLGVVVFLALLSTPGLSFLIDD